VKRGMKLNVKNGMMKKKKKKKMGMKKKKKKMEMEMKKKKKKKVEMEMKKKKKKMEMKKIKKMKKTLSQEKRDLGFGITSHSLKGKGKKGSEFVRFEVVGKLNYSFFIHSILY
jgi:hypothetical protein